MLTVSHRTSYSIGEGESAETKYVWTEVEMPQTVDDLLKLKPDPRFDNGELVDICVSYDKLTGKRVYISVPFIVAQFIEGYKLTINTAVRPKDGVVLSDEVVNEYKLAFPSDATLVELTFSIGQKKHQKVLKEKILAWKASV